MPDAGRPQGAGRAQVDRGPAGEPDVGGPGASRARHRAHGVRRRLPDPRDADRPCAGRRRLPDAEPVDGRRRRGLPVPRAVPGAVRHLLDEVRVHEHERPHRVSRAVAVRVPRAGGRSRHRGAPDRDRPGGAASSQPAPSGRAAVHQRERHAVRPHLAVGDVRAGAGDARLRGLPEGAARRARCRSSPRGRHLHLRRAHDERAGVLRDRGRDDPHRAVGHRERLRRRRLDGEQPRDDGGAAHG